ncbi:hypothetical protein [Stenotrophomonas sp. Ste96]|uniref:hypothetical protein n=1 Tax=Stenotrophomonas sp. Ste96 TaxID=2926029 RepID=UPI0021C6166C|nr:hypothetical protein [Stenotrophomonas sp. Ste96]
MPRPLPSSPGSAPCQLEWHPSRWQCRALIAMGALMPWALWATELPAPWGLALGLVAMVGTWLEAWRYARGPGCAFLIPLHDEPAQVDGEAVEDLQMRRRGPLLQLRWRYEGRRHWRLFWPDTLPAAQARELRLAVRAHCISRSPPAVAP